MQDGSLLFNIETNLCTNKEQPGGPAPQNLPLGINKLFLNFLMMMD
jgi:hypothetical protein